MRDEFRAELQTVSQLLVDMAEAVRAAMDEVDEPTREVSERLLRDVLAAIADARAASPSDAAPEPEPQPENEAPVSGTRPKR